MMAAEGRGPVMHANAGIGRVVYGPPKIPEPRLSKETKWGRRKLKLRSKLPKASMAGCTCRLCLSAIGPGQMGASRGRGR
jgi:hypothetical protein